MDINTNFCPSCNGKFDASNKNKRKLIDACGHAKCYSCMFAMDYCVLCDVLSQTSHASVVDMSTRYPQQAPSHYSTNYSTGNEVISPPAPTYHQSNGVPSYPQEGSGYGQWSNSKGEVTSACCVDISVLLRILTHYYLLFTTDSLY